jgi:hypothetical protein
MLRRMELANVTGELSYTELARIVDDHTEPFLSALQCQIFLRAASMLWRREPAETDQSGDRVSKRDLQVQMIEARKSLAVFQFGTARTTVITPTHDLQ